MVSCKIKGCKNRSDKKGQPKLHFFSFPKDPETASKWIEVCKHSVNIKNSRVCSVHFQPSCYKPRPVHLKDLNYSQSGVRTLLPDAVPTESIATDDTSRSVTKHQKRAQNPSVKNNNNQNVLYVSDLNVNEKVPAVLYLQVLDNNLKHQFKSVSTPPTSVKYISGHSNLDVRLERIEAPSYILDHQYAANSNQNSNVIDDPMKKNENSNEVHNTTNLEIRPKLNNSLSDQDQIAQLKRQLQIKTMEHQTVQKQLKRLQNESKNFVNKRVRDILKNVFSTNQIDKLINPFKSKIKWSIEDIISAISLQNISLKAYSYLRNNNYPLPGLSTIRKWTTNIKVAEGLLTDVLTVMKHRAKSLSVFQKIVILNFSEISIAQKNCQICMVRGLFYKWIQPIYYSFNKTLTTNVVKEIISKLYDAEYIVVAITSNYQSFDDQIWTDLNIGVQNSRKCYFDHPKTNSYKVFVFPCESNLLSLIGQYFFKSGFIVNGKQVNKRCLEEIAEINKNSPGDNVYKLTAEFLGTYKSDNHSAFSIKKLFTKEIASEITYFGNGEFILYKDWKYVAEFFESLGNWIDLCNSQMEEGFKEGEEPYGFHLEYQNKVLNKMEKLMLTTKIVDLEKSSIIQDQVILKNNSLKELLIYLKQNFSIEDFQINYILTARFSGELLEHFYEYLSDEDASSDNFAITNFQNKLRKCLLGKHFHDASFRKVVKYPEPCIIDFNEKSDATAEDIKQPKGATIVAAGKIRKFLTINNIPAQKVHKNLLHILSKKETEK